MPDNARAYQLDLIAEANRKLKSQPLFETYFVQILRARE